MGNLNINPKVWLEELFEFENCATCGKGAENHDAIPFIDNWFARCKPIKITEYNEKLHDAIITITEHDIELLSYEGQTLFNKYALLEEWYAKAYAEENDHVDASLSTLVFRDRRLLELEEELWQKFQIDEEFLKAYYDLREKGEIGKEIETWVI